MVSRLKHLYEKNKINENIKTKNINKKKKIKINIQVSFIIFFLLTTAESYLEDN